MHLIHVQEAKIQKAIPSRGKGYTEGSSCITNILKSNKEAKIHVDSGASCNGIGKGYPEKIYTNCGKKLIPIESIKLSSASHNMDPLAISEAEKYILTLHEV
ncbi:hypothetical protein O181_058587 [Austropuccinia psidii MF-1]|uniref:Uncharacterized protein n=1 Tax=Austropuccinia psidii MF-1 TaxID=1389203 RepID=A0A9Q3EEZ2_9BASI|nr:hypothetical protein [Austropuccinia psidii MF-1]